MKFIAEYKQQGQKVYVHCKAGHGRGGGVAFAWLMSQDLEADPKVLQQQLSKKRKVRKVSIRTLSPDRTLASRKHASHTFVAFCLSIPTAQPRRHSTSRIACSFLETCTAMNEGEEIRI